MNPLRVSAMQVMISKAGALFLTARHTPAPPDLPATYFQLLLGLLLNLCSSWIFAFTTDFFCKHIYIFFFAWIQTGWCKCLQAKSLIVQPNTSLCRWHVPITSKGLTMCTNTSLRCIFLGRRQRTLCCFRLISGIICAQLRYK